jgi:hypothetical protein
MIKRFFKWLDSLNKLSPIEKAEIEWEETKEDLLEALSNQEHYDSLVKTLTTREKRLSLYITQNHEGVL